MRFFLQAIFGQIFLNAYIIWRGHRVFPPKSIGHRLFVLFFVIELMLYFLGYFFYKDLPDSLFIPIMMICTTWYIASIYIAFGLLVIDLVRVSIKLVRLKSIEIYKSQWRKMQRGYFCFLVVFVGGLMVKGYHNAVYPAVRHLGLHIPKTVEGKDSLTIVMMSDLHIGEAIGKKHVRRMVELCNAESPDLVVIAGDILDYELRWGEKAHIEEDLQRLNAPLGVYIALGNHEYRANRFAKTRWIEKTGGVLLVDSVAMPDAAFYLIGRDDVINGERAALETLLQGVDRTKPVIVVEHQPVYVEDMMANQCDLGLYGHTHNGQYWPFSLLLKFAFKYPNGYYTKDGSHIYVSSGVGFAGPPFRIGTRSEIVVIRLKFN